MMRLTARITATVLLFAAGLLGSSSFAQTWGDGMYHEGIHDMMWGGKLPAVTITGKAIVDTTGSTSNGMPYASMWRYYIDTVGTGDESYQLFFGPYWYQPKSGAQRPINGQTVTIRGGSFTQSVPPVLVVYEINGKVWDDSTGAAPWSGRWIGRSITDSVRVFCPIDSLSRIAFPPGFMGMGMMGGGMMWPDSLFCDFDEMYPDSLPGIPHNGALLGFHLDVFNPQGMPMMQSGTAGHGMMGFQRALLMRFRVHPDSLSHHGLTIDRVTLKYLDTDGIWKPFSSQIVDTQAGTITVAQANVYSYIAIAPSAATSIGEQSTQTPTTFTLGQNYPNPFNPSTTIEFALPSASYVTLAVYNVVGEEVATLVSQDLAAGKYRTQWNASQVPSGIYFYRLKAGNLTQVKRLVLMK